MPAQAGFLLGKECVFVAITLGIIFYIHTYLPVFHVYAHTWQIVYSANRVGTS